MTIRLRRNTVDLPDLAGEANHVSGVADELHRGGLVQPVPALAVNEICIIKVLNEEIYYRICRLYLYGFYKANGLLTGLFISPAQKQILGSNRKFMCC